MPLAPKDLTTEPAKDANSDFSQELGILLLWNAPDDPAGATVTGYTISRRVKPVDGTWSEWDDAWASISAVDLLRTYFTDIDEPDEGEERAYRVLATSARGNSDWSEMAYAPTMPGMHNTAPMAEGMIDPVTVTAGMMSDAMDVSGYFSDADMDTLTYTATVMPADGSIATADIPAGSSMLTITGVAAGMATITVTATDPDGAYVMQTFMVTVEAADTTPRAPSGVMAEVVTDDRPEATVYNVKVTWTEGANAEAHGVLLFTSDFSLTDHIARGLGGSHTFENVAAGSYIAVVVVLDAQDGLVTDANGDYLYAGAESTVTVQQ